GAVTRTIPVAGANQLALSPDGATLYATNWRGHAVSAITLATSSVQVVPTGLHPTDVAVLPSGRVLVADANDATVATFVPGDAAAARAGTGDGRAGRRVRDGGHARGGHAAGERAGAGRADAARAGDVREPDAGARARQSGPRRAGRADQAHHLHHPREQDLRR